MEESFLKACPVCQTAVSFIWQHTGGNGEGTGWFAGRYWCRRCSLMIAASGGVKDEVVTVLSWLPGCPEHGTPHVVRTDERVLISAPREEATQRFRCLDCDRSFEARNGRLITTRKPKIEALAVAPFEREAAGVPTMMN